MRRPLLALLFAAPIAAQSRPFGELLPDTLCEGSFVATADGLQGVEIPVATYGRRNECLLVAELFSSESRLARAEWVGADLVDNSAIELPCPVQPNSAGCTYRVRLTSPDARPGNAVTAWVDPATGLRMSPSYSGDLRMLGELVAGARVVQTFVAPADGLHAVSLLFTDFGRTTNAGRLHVTVRDPLQGVELASASLDAASIGNEDWRSLRFEPVADSGGRSFAVTIEASQGEPGHSVTLYLDRGDGLAGDLTVNGRPRLGRLWLNTGCAVPTRGAWLLPWLCATAAAGLAWGSRRASTKRRSLGFGAAAAFAACVPVVMFAYERDLRWVFWPAFLIAAVTAPIAALRLMRHRRWCVQLSIVPLPLVLLLLLAEPFRGVRAGAQPTATANVAVDLHARPWAFDTAAGDPQRFRAWWQRLTGEWNAKDRGCTLVQRPDPVGELPFVLQPGTSTRFFESTIRINNLGLRGPDAPHAKGDAFRIVCVGESTTMGQTLFATDLPWPEVLQRELAAPRGRRIEVLNAGWASYDVRHSAIRLRRFLLDLEPDVVVLYHGYNGFWMLMPNVAKALVAGSRLPERTARPSWVLAEAEYGLRLATFRAGLTQAAQGPIDRDANRAAAAYREILTACSARGVRVLLCSFNMAVDENSPAEVIEFYRAGFPQVEHQMVANRMQTELLRRLAAEYPLATFVDTSQGLDGAFRDAYVDLVHFTQIGRERLAHAIAAGLRPLLPQ